MSNKLKVMFVAEAYGAYEERFEHALVGPSGREFAWMLANTNFAPSISMRCSRCRNQTFFPICHACKERQYPNELIMIKHWAHLREHYGIGITNVFNIRPPDNDLTTFFPREVGPDKWMPGYKATKVSGSFLRHDLRHHLERLWEELETARPNLIICLGNTACWAILQATNIRAIRGTIKLSPKLGIKCLPTYHPAAIFRTWRWRPIVLSDFIKGKRECEYPEIRQISRVITFCPEYDPTYLDQAEAWLQQPIEKSAIDVESGYVLYTRAELANMTPSMRYILSSQLSMVGFARSLNDAMTIPLMTRNSPDLSFWPTLKEEKRAWELIQLGCANDSDKIFQNGMYDIVRLRYAGVKVNRPRRDTMLHHHAVYPEMEKGLGFLGSIYTDMSSWKTMYSTGESLKRDD